MYEPKYLPVPDQTLKSLSRLRFAIVPCDQYRRSDNPDADPLHVHRYLEIFVNISSDVSFLANNKLYPVLSGDALVVRPGDIHMGIFHKSAVHEFVCLWIDADFSAEIFSFLHRDSFCPLFSFDEKTKKHLKTLVFSLLDACRTGGTELVMSSLLLQILVVLERGSTVSTETLPIPVALQSILDDIRENFSTIKDINAILKSHFVSSSTLTRYFRKYIHSSPREYLEAIRLSNAASMLARGASVTEACMRSGFSDVSRFIALFKKKFGETPLKYKQRRM